MRSLTRKRRSAAKPLVLLVALFLMGAVYSVISPATQSSADTTTDAQVAAGKSLFTVTCSSCHGTNAEGTSQGPSLIGVGAASVDFQMSTGRMPLAHPGAQAVRRAVTYTGDEISAIAAYIASLAPGPAIPTSDQYSPAGLTADEIARGGELFRTNCSACHNFEGHGGALPGGKFAPTLVGVADRNIYEALRIGPQNMPVFSKGVLSDTDVRQIIGYLNQVQTQPQQGGFDLGGIGPVSEGFWAWVLGMGSLVGVAVWLAKKGARAR